MIGRALVRVPVRSRLIRPAYHGQRGQVAKAPTVLFLRTYATPGRPKSVVGEPSKPVKRAVKKAAAKPPTGDSPAEKRVAANERKAAKKTAGSTKKALTQEQKELAEQRKLKKDERLAKAKATEKARKDKLKARTKASSEKAKASAVKEELKELKKAALQPPNLKQRRSYNYFFTEVVMKKHDLATGTNQDRRDTLARASRDASEQWKDLSPAEREVSHLLCRYVCRFCSEADLLQHYNHLANSNAQETQAQYKKWVESHSADEIQQANVARRALRRKLEQDRPKRTRSKWPPIHDERAVKRPSNPFAQFVMNRNASGDFKGITLPERGKLIGQEWKALSDLEKSVRHLVSMSRGSTNNWIMQKYQNLGSQERERYATEYKDTYGHEHAQAAAAAA